MKGCVHFSPNMSRSPRSSTRLTTPSARLIVMEVQVKRDCRRQWFAVYHIYVKKLRRAHDVCVAGM